MQNTLYRQSLGVMGHPHNGGGDPKKLPLILGGVEKVLGGATPPGVIPPIMGGSHPIWGVALGGAKILRFQVAPPPEWGVALGVANFRTGSIQIDQKISSRRAKKKTTEIFLFTLRNSTKNLRASRGNLSKLPLNTRNSIHASQNLLLRILRANCQFVTFYRKSIKILWYHKGCFTREARDFLLIFQG